jgi:transcriptional regulator with XRE-family HTH domain
MSRAKEDSQAVDIPQLVGSQMTRLSLSRDQVAEAVGVNVDAVRKWLAGERRPSAELWPDLASVLQLPVSEIAVAYGVTKPVRIKTFKARALEAEAEVARLQAELDRCRRDLLSKR